MAEQPAQYTEKRVKSTVIRRRKKASTPAEDKAKLESKEDQPAEAKPEASAETAQSEAEAQPKEKATSSKTKTTAKETKKAKDKSGSPSEDEKEAPALTKTAATAEDEDEAKVSKAKKKGPKRKTVAKGAEIDAEEIGEVGGALNQISRVAHVERVFQPSRLPRRKKIISKKSIKKTNITISKQIKRIIEVDKQISVGDLGKAMGVKSSEVIKFLMNMGTMATQNQAIDIETATIVAQEFNFEVKDVSFNEQKVIETFDEGVSANVVTRPPIVTVMGHVDHGKTSLLDAIRQSNVTESEAGGITQHIGAYTVRSSKGDITFLDTPGHAAFTTMRARGASVTDVVILVVAADDGVMPQTIESINHAKAAEVPIVVAVNKIDKPDADVDKIKRQLSENGLVSEDWGGDTMFYMVSAKQKEGIDELLEGVGLQAEVLELKADPDILARGVVVEAKLDRSRGPVATLLVQQGTLKVGESIVAGCYSGRVRSMMDHHGQQIESAGPSTAVEIMGLDGVPAASDTFNVAPNEQKAKMIAEKRAQEKRSQELTPTHKVSLEDFFSQAEAAEVKELKVILRADVQGSAEAIKESLSKIESDKVKVQIIHASVGGITESDIMLASASNAIIIGFNVRPETSAIAVAESEGVDIKLYKIIYEMIDDVKKAMKGLLEPKKIEKYLGRAEVRETFTISKLGLIAGCHVVDGRMVRGTGLRLLRDNVILHEGIIGSLKRFKDDAKEVKEGFECGVGIQGYQDIKPGDLIEAFEIEYTEADL